MDPAWVGATTAAVVAAATGAGWAVRRIWRLLHGTSQFLEEWGGAPAHNGLAATPGVMARLGAVEKVLDKVLHETTPNGGGNLRDLMARTALDVADIKDEQSRLRAQLDLRHPPEGKP
jgi:hypothetical protein